MCFEFCGWYWMMTYDTNDWRCPCSGMLVGKFGDIKIMFSYLLQFILSAFVICFHMQCYFCSKKELWLVLSDSCFSFWIQFWKTINVAINVIYSLSDIWLFNTVTLVCFLSHFYSWKFHNCLALSWIAILNRMEKRFLKLMSSYIYLLSQLRCFVFTVILILIFIFCKYYLLLILR